MSATDIVQGELRVVGEAHGSINTMEVYYDAPDEWAFRQFVTDLQMHEYARTNSLTVVIQHASNSSPERE